MCVCVRAHTRALPLVQICAHSGWMCASSTSLTMCSCFPHHHHSAPSFTLHHMQMHAHTHFYVHIEPPAPTHFRVLCPTHRITHACTGHAHRAPAPTHFHVPCPTHRITHACTGHAHRAPAPDSRCPDAAAAASQSCAARRLRAHLQHHFTPQGTFSFFLR